jgi:chemosensory pili system protein ChpA (sensor histidine kinase/response regulator)
VLTARDGLDALRVLGRNHVDLALVDLLMPLMDGYELIAHLRREPGPLGRLPLIAVTALGHDEDLVRTWNEGADAHVTKPVDYDLIMGVIRRVMATRRATAPPSRPSRRPPRRPGS